MKLILGGVFKGYNLVKQPTSEIPEQVSKVVENLNKNSHSYSYTPTWYFGSKATENGTSYLVTCERQKNEFKQIRLMTVVISNGRSRVNLESLILPEPFQKLFDSAMGNSEEIKHMPLTFVGFESTPKGKNYYVLCQSEIKNHESYVTIVIISEQGELIDTIRLGGLGYAFTW